MRRIPRALKVLLYALGGLAGLLLLTAVGVSAFVDFDSYKPRVVSAASNALGMEVVIEGPLGFGLLPAPHVTAGKVRVRNRGSEVLFVDSADVGLELLPLFRKELRYTGITLHGSRLSIERGRNGKYNYMKESDPRKQFGGMDLARVSFPGLVVAYLDKSSGAGFEAGKCEAELRRLRHPGGGTFLGRLSLSGELACEEVRGNQRTISDLKLTLEGKEGVFDFKPITMQVAGGQGTGSVRMDRTAAVPILHLEYALSKFRIEDFFKRRPSGNSLTGLMDFSAALAMRGHGRADWRRSASGRMSLSGANLTLAGVDLETKLSRLEASQNFNLFDLGAFLLGGPLGILVTKGAEISSVAQQAGGSTRIRTVVSKWKVEKGVARAEDVALATREHRLALRGGLDFADDEFDEAYLALVDANGCATLRQRIRGRLGEPVLEKPTILQSVSGPVANLITKAKTALLPDGEGKCEVFYSGSVTPAG